MSIELYCMFYIDILPDLFIVYYWNVYYVWHVCSFHIKPYLHIVENWIELQCFLFTCIKCCPDLFTVYYWTVLLIQDLNPICFSFTSELCSFYFLRMLNPILFSVQYWTVLHVIICYIYVLKTGVLTTELVTPMEINYPPAVASTQGLLQWFKDTRLIILYTKHMFQVQN